MAAGRLVERVVRLAEAEAERLQQLYREAGRLLRAVEALGLLHYLDEPRGWGEAAGVDGFFMEVARTPGRRLYAYRVVGVNASPRGSSGLLTVHEDVVAVEEAGGEEMEEYVEYAMMRVEAETAAELSGRYSVVLDGPIVDPPHMPYTEMAARSYGGYHAWRSRLLRGRRVAGYVKRVRGRRLADLLGRRGLGDAELAYIILAKALEEHPEAAAAWLGPLSPGEGEPYSLYEGVESAYLLTPWWRGVRGVEAWDAGWGVELVVSTTPRGLQHPAPVEMAHEEAGRLALGADALRRLFLSRIAMRPGARSLLALAAPKTGGGEA
ncbi:MAG: DNA double-strand break repair nuclease NurA [Crenarchaeota archaeon]|nr:DNA double-strand break repair nuclease NurA [Thermoproteota archaeon]